jgi:hypothetical protein
MCVAAGTDPFGEPCDDGVDNCAPGSQCRADGESLTCAPYCRADRDCPGGWRCFCGVAGLTPDDEYRGCCNAPEPCDPFTAEGCAPGETCVFFGGSSECRTAGTTGPGEDCETSECVAGSVCLWREGAPSPLCSKYCRLDGGFPDCSDVPGTVCAAGLGSPLVGLCSVAGG